MKSQQLNSYLKDIVQEAIDKLSDKNIQGISVQRVQCTSNKKDATVYIYDEGDNLHIDKTISSLRKSIKRINHLVMLSTGWFQSPKLMFKFDKQRANLENMDKLFSQLSSTK